MHGFAGRLTRDPEGRDAGDSYVVRFRIATNRAPYRDRQGNEPPPVFTNVEFWGERARAFMQQASEGTPVLVLGEWAASEWIDKETNEKRHRQYLSAAHVGIAVTAPRQTQDVPSQREPATQDVGTREDAPRKADAEAEVANDSFFE